MTIIGPNAHATFSVPFFWKEKSTIAINAAIITRILWLIPAFPGISLRPSTAERILIAGVITASPIRSDTPIIARREKKATALPDCNNGSRISFNTIVPPSPFRPDCIASHAY